MLSTPHLGQKLRRPGTATYERADEVYCGLRWLNDTGNIHLNSMPADEYDVLQTPSTFTGMVRSSN